MFLSHKKGEMAQLKVEMRCLEKGFLVCYPTVEARFDMIIVSPKGKCFRAQIKYLGHEPSQCKSDGSAIYLDLRKETRNNGKKKTYSSSEVDVILAYIPQIDKVIWVGPKLFHKTQSLTFRLKNPKYKCSTSRTISDFIW